MHDEIDRSRSSMLWPWVICPGFRLRLNEPPGSLARMRQCGEYVCWPGGTHACTYLIRTADPELEFILREFPPGDDAARNESRVLSALALMIHAGGGLARDGG
jgi:hypothetical protein